APGFRGVLAAPGAACERTGSDRSGGADAVPTAHTTGETATAVTRPPAAGAISSIRPPPAPATIPGGRGTSSPIRRVVCGSARRGRRTLLAPDAPAGCRPEHRTFPGAECEPERRHCWAVLRPWSTLQVGGNRAPIQDTAPVDWHQGLRPRP